MTEPLRRKPQEPEPRAREPQGPEPLAAEPQAPEPSVSTRSRPSRRLPERAEQGLSAVQLAVLLPVVVLLVSGIGVFIYGTVIFIHAISAISGHLYAHHNLGLLLTEIDLFLIGVTMIIAGFGLYELFISRADYAGPGRADGAGRVLPAWLVMNDLNDLKARILSMIVLIAAVSFVDVLVEFGPARDVLYVGAGVAVMILALTVYLRFGSDNERG